MKTTLWSAAGAFALAAVAFSGVAQAQCVWTGYSWSCPAAPPAYTQSYGGGYQYAPASPYAAFNAYDYRDYRYQPEWLPSSPGPRAGGH